jgi:phosphomannomutase/phosphoglucomutase
MRVNPNIFRRYDIRGQYPEDFNEIIAAKISAAFCNLYPQVKSVVLAQDTRLSSFSISQKVIENLLVFGKKVINLGIVPDGVYFFSIFRKKFDAGIMITASHNPPSENGMSFYVYLAKKEKVGADLIEKEMEKLKTLVLKENLVFPEKVSNEEKVINLDLKPDYIDFVTSKINFGKKLKVIIDSGNGACGFLPEKIFKKLGFEAKTIYGEFDGNFPHHLADPYDPKNLEDLQKTVIKERADLGFAFDADGDRVAAIDSKGRIISGDTSLYLFCENILKKTPGPIVHDVRVSLALLELFEKYQVKNYFSISHHSAIIRKIIETDAVFGGEVTMHFLFPKDYYLYDDAIFAALKLAEIASSYQNFASFLDNLKPYYFLSPEFNIKIADSQKYQLIENLKEYLKKKNYDLIEVDGARILFDQGWLLIRASNTSPLIKCRFEGKTKKDYQTLKKFLKNLLKIFQEKFSFSVNLAI